MSLVALKRIGVTTDQLTLLNQFRFQLFQQFFLNQLCLRFSLQADDTHCFALIARVCDTTSNLGDNRIRFGIVLGMLTTPRPITILNMPEHQRLQAVCRVSS
ncbi:hypothetical protein D3C76_1497860 [compost metagenome]